MEQLLAHLVGDYLLQNHWMATNKTRSWGVAIIHALCYTLPFLFFHPSPFALAVITGSHAVIDRYGLAAKLCAVKNGSYPLPFPAGTPPGLVIGLVIVVDNTLHLLINAAVL